MSRILDGITGGNPSIVQAWMVIFAYQRIISPARHERLSAEAGAANA
jgi:hypothetical protein